MIEGNAGAKPAALVTSARGRVAYAVVRSLARQGVPVFVADSNRTAMSFFSRHVRGCFRCPSPFRSPDRFVRFLNEVGQEHSIRVLIPTWEETYMIAKYRDELSRSYQTVLMDYASLIRLHDKSKWVACASAAGVPVPRTLPVERLLADEGLLREWQFPVLMKPKQGGGGWGVREFHTRRDLERVLRGPWPEEMAPENFNLQERIDGNTVCVAMIYDRGRFVAKVAYETLRNYPQPFGQATLRRTISNPQAEDDLRKLLDSLAWHGVCQADFVIDRSTGRAYLVDLNPRFWGSLALAVAAGVDFPYLLYRTALGEKAPAAETFPVGVYCRWLGGELTAAASRIFTAGGLRDLFSLFSRPGRTKMNYDDFVPRDPLPFMGWLLDVSAAAVSAKFRASRRRDTLDGIWT